ncbi:cell envelope integrity EipB family protein [Pseudoxanthobacter sp. M-2]|uniref:cell envelope integrity EipB family protein n=1 Tax=Pseudoxanthobacter sp. M-2 TaxID=3078754 RepID=UPI0038FC617A
MPSPRPLATLLAGAVLVAALPAAAATAPVSKIAAGLQPHRAVYDMSLGESDENGTILGVAGRIVTEFTGSACEGFTTNFRFVSRIDDQEGGSRLTDLRTTSYEDATGETFQFVTQSYVDQKLSEESKGVATRDGDEVIVDLAKPAQKQTTFQNGPLFPTQHLVKVIEAAEAGGTILQGDLYDGSEKGEKVFATTAVIGRPASGVDEAGMDDAKAVETLGAGARWPVRLSYFEMGGDRAEQKPMYELSFLVYANGVTRKLELDYGDFTILGKLTSIEYLDAKPCE